MTDKPFFEIAAELTRPLGVRKPRPAREDALRWYDVEDYTEDGGMLRIGYTVDEEPGDEPTIWIHKTELVNEVDLPKWQAVIADQVAADNEIAARELSHGTKCRCADCRAEYGEWLRDQQIDKECE